jgi:hypothetical protein
LTLKPIDTLRREGGRNLPHTLTQTFAKLIPGICCLCETVGRFASFRLRCSVHIKDGIFRGDVSNGQ